ncbi:ATP-binding protein, partial [Bacteroidota bacterium]
MIKSFHLILISSILFIGINTVLYFSIYNQQLDFQTEILARQTQLCGNTIEQEGQQFENELNSIPYQDDFSKLFNDDNIKERGAINLRKLYTGYNQLINKITVFDNHNNVFGLILDAKNNFVSDYYESQQQVPLNGRDQLSEDQGKYQLSIPGFDATGTVQTNILVDVNYQRFVNDIFERFRLDNILWQFLITEDGELISMKDSIINIPEGVLKRIGAAIQELEEGSMVHTVSVDGELEGVVSVYYPVRLVKRDLGIIFSIKTDLFLRSIIIKIILITLCSLLLLALLLYINFRVVNVRSAKLQAQKLSEDSFLSTIDTLPFGLMLLDPDGDIRMMNRSARGMFSLDGESKKLNCGELNINDSLKSFDDSDYKRVFGQGSMVLVRHESGIKHVYKVEFDSQAGDIETKLVLLVDVSELEKSRKLDNISHKVKTEMIESMAQEISVPLNQLQKTVAENASIKGLQKTLSLISGLIDSTIDFAGREAIHAVTERIPFCLRTELDLALKPFSGNHADTSIITKVRNDVPDKLVGDPFGLRQIITNLVENSIELTGEGRIVVSAEVLERHPSHLKLKFSVEDTGSGLSEDMIKELVNQPDPDSGIRKEGFEKRLVEARQHIELLRGQFCVESPSTISTSLDMPGTKYTFSINVASWESLDENLVFKDISRLEEIECLVLSQHKESENEMLEPLLEMGLKLKYLIYREENTESLYELVKEKAPDLHLLCILDSDKQNGFRIAEDLIRQDFTKKLVVMLLGEDPKPDNYPRYQ